MYLSPTLVAVLTDAIRQAKAHEYEEFLPYMEQAALIAEPGESVLPWFADHPDAMARVMTVAIPWSLEASIALAELPMAELAANAAPPEDASGLLLNDGKVIVSKDFGLHEMVFFVGIVD